jgi:hypothetical protein
MADYPGEARTEEVGGSATQSPRNDAPRLKGSVHSAQLRSLGFMRSGGPKLSSAEEGSLRAVTGCDDYGFGGDGLLAKLNAFDGARPRATDADRNARRSVPVGQALRVTVSVAGQGMRRRNLVIEADEV